MSRQKLNKSLLRLNITLVCILLSTCCDDLEWSCVSGQCISSEKVCDGSIECQDGSDETADTCITNSCPPFSFRCTYGACVPRAAKCNGVSDCADNSDESNLLCNPDGISVNTICTVDEFLCDANRCLPHDAVCDGAIDCTDQSDETVENCASNYCPSPFFRCGYGACIKADKMCDGVEHCVDGSDESFNLCGVNPISKTTPSIITEAYVERVTPLPTPAMVDKTSCTAPNITNSQLVYEGTLRNVYPGDEIPNYNSIVYNCQPNYIREGLGTNVCVNGKWASGFHPTCLRYCSHQNLKGITFNVHCKLGEVTVACNNRIKPGTRAHVSCPPKYRVPDHNPIQDLLCEHDGQWDYPPSRCEPICGEDLLPNQAFTSHGQSTNITEVPWHVAIYMQNGAINRHICGGSIINAKVVLSAAHCFWDGANEDLYDARLFSIGAGKNMRDYYSTNEIRKPQFRNVSEIAIPPEYKHFSAVFKGDLAVVVLTQPLVFSDFIAPICIKWQRDAAKAITNGVYGKVAGWGLTETGAFSEELQSIYVPASSYQTCRNEVDPQYRESVADDKFCVANKYGTAVCSGDSGGGFAVKSEVDGKGRYFLWGVVSYGVPRGLSCSHQIFDSYTNIQFYEGFVKNMETLNRPR